MSLINFICPDTARPVTSAINHPAEPTRLLETIICPCCERFHVLNTEAQTVAHSADVTPITILNYYAWERIAR
jgi:hypothetical protein